MTLEGKILSRLTKRVATDEEYNQLLLQFLEVVEGMGLEFGGHLACGFIFHAERSMTVELLHTFTLELQRILGGSYYYDGRLRIENGEIITLDEARFLRENLPPPKEGGDTSLN